MGFCSLFTLDKREKMLYNKNGELCFVTACRTDVRQYAADYDLTNEL